MFFISQKEKNIEINGCFENILYLRMKFSFQFLSKRKNTFQFLLTKKWFQIFSFKQTQSE